MAARVAHPHALREVLGVLALGLAAAADAAPDACHHLTAQHSKSGSRLRCCLGLILLMIAWLAKTAEVASHHPQKSMTVDHIDCPFQVIYGWSCYIDMSSLVAPQAGSFSGLKESPTCGKSLDILVQNTHTRLPHPLVNGQGCPLAHLHEVQGWRLALPERLQKLPSIGDAVHNRHAQLPAVREGQLPGGGSFLQLLAGGWQPDAGLLHTL